MPKTPHAEQPYTGPAAGRDIVIDTTEGLTVPSGVATPGHVPTSAAA